MTIRPTDIKACKHCGQAIFSKTEADYRESYTVWVHVENRKRECRINFAEPA